MGSCLCKDIQAGDSTMEENQPPAPVVAEEAPASPRAEDVLDLLIIQTLRHIGTYHDGPEEPPAPLARVNQIADTDEGWHRVVVALIRTIPLYDPLGPSTIVIVMEDCPLPPRDVVIAFTRSFHFGADRCVEAYINDDSVRQERNLLVVLGCIAEKYPGPDSIEIFTDEVFQYLVGFLGDEREPAIVLHALITIEKFARTAENKRRIENYFSNRVLNPLMLLEFHHNSDTLLWRQVGFCARWALDNNFVYSERRFSFETVRMDDIRTILNVHDVSEYLKISPDGLEARCDSQSFESVRATYKIETGVWYYEVKIITAGVMQIGWATKRTSFQNHDGYGVGDDSFSIAYDGCRRLIWYRAEARRQEIIPSWQPGDIVGCLIDVERQEAIFSLNGYRLPVCTEIFSSSSDGVYAAASFMTHQQCRFNFGSKNYVYPPQDRDFKSMNAYGKLTENDKVLPRRRILEGIIQEQRDIERCCIICYDDLGHYGLGPCEHGGFCLKCVKKLQLLCPLCRRPFTEFYILTL